MTVQNASPEDVVVAMSELRNQNGTNTLRLAAYGSTRFVTVSIRHTLARILELPQRADFANSIVVSLSNTLFSMPDTSDLVADQVNFNFIRRELGACSHISGEANKTKDQ